MSNNKKKNFYDICMYASAATLSVFLAWVLMLNYGGTTNYDKYSLKDAQAKLNKTETRYDILKDSLNQEVDKKIEADIKFQEVYPRALHKDSTISDYYEFRMDPDVRAADSICDMYYNQVYGKHRDELASLGKAQTELQTRINKITADKARADSIAQMSTMDRIKGNLRLLKNDLIR